MLKFHHIVITGASSGIGEALALHYAAPHVRLSLSGRNAKRLDSVVKRCRDKGADAQETLVDVRDEAAMKNWLLGADRRMPVDLLIANAGISAGTGGAENGEDRAQIREVFDVNLNGVLHTLQPLLPLMRERGRGHIALMSSLAGFRGWPGAPAYCASKAAIKSYGEALRGALRSSGVSVHVICPGFVNSRMTDVNDFPMPFKIGADKAAQIIARGIERDKGRIAFPFIPALLCWFLGAAPDALAGRLLQGMPAKRAAGD
jgi:short-subunit dehydrogenase